MTKTIKRLKKDLIILAIKNNLEMKQGSDRWGDKTYYFESENFKSESFSLSFWKAGFNFEEWGLEG